MENPQVAQAKREAKRLLRIAKTTNSDNPQILIHNLSEAKEIVARLQGYPNWRTFEDAKQRDLSSAIESSLPINQNLSFDDVENISPVANHPVNYFLKILPKERTDSEWNILFNHLKELNLEKIFEETAGDFAITKGISPPNWKTFSRIGHDKFKNIKIITTEEISSARETGFVSISEQDGPSMGTTLSEVGRSITSTTINIKDNFENQKDNPIFYYRKKNDTTLPNIKKKNKDFEFGTIVKEKSGFLNIIKPQEEKLFLSESDMRKHLLILGAGGSGRRTFLELLGIQQIQRGDPLVFFDGSYDPSILKEFFSNSIRMGKTLNGGARGLILGDQPEEFSGSLSSIDPFEDYLPDTLAYSLVNDTSEDNTMWQGRAIALISPILHALFELRENTNLVIDVPLIRFCMTFEGLLFLQSNPFVSKTIKLGIKRYFDALPGCKLQENILEFEPTSVTNHGFLTMQISQSLSYIEKGYKRGYFSTTPTDSIREVIEKNISFYIGISHMDKKFDEVLFLMSFIAKKFHYLIQKDITYGLNRCLKLIVFNEIILEKNYSYQFLMPARSCGYSFVFSYQDGHQLNPYIEANTYRKILFKMEDPKSTPELIQKLIWNNSEIENKEKQIKVSNDHLLMDLHLQRAGHFHYFCEGKVQKVKGFYKDRTDKEFEELKLEPRYSLIQVEEE